MLCAQALDGSAAARAVPQDGAAACPAPKVAPEEGVLDWRLPAKTLHNKARPNNLASFSCQSPGYLSIAQPALTNAPSDTCRFARLRAGQARAAPSALGLTEKW